jgi:hypothetical protein
MRLEQSDELAAALPHYVFAALRAREAAQVTPAGRALTLF